MKKKQKEPPAIIRETMEVRARFKPEGLAVEVPSHCTDDWWLILQQKVLEHFQDCDRRGIRSELITGFDSMPGYAKEMSQLWNEAREKCEASLKQEQSK